MQGSKGIGQPSLFGAALLARVSGKKKRKPKAVASPKKKLTPRKKKKVAEITKSAEPKPGRPKRIKQPPVERNIPKPNQPGKGGCETTRYLGVKGTHNAGLIVNDLHIKGCDSKGRDRWQGTVVDWLEWDAWQLQDNAIASGYIDEWEVTDR